MCTVPTFSSAFPIRMIWLNALQTLVSAQSKECLDSRSFQIDPLVILILKNETDNLKIFNWLIVIS